MDKKDMTIKGAKVALDVALMAIPAVQGVKTVNTMHKLAKCGKGMKMVATFTGNAQKANAIKALGNVGKAGLKRIAVEVLLLAAPFSNRSYSFIV